MEMIQFILAICAILGLNFALINMLNNNLKDVFRAELQPINEKLNNHITETDKKIDEINKKIDILLKRGNK